MFFQPTKVPAIGISGRSAYIRLLLSRSSVAASNELSMIKLVPNAETETMSPVNGANQQACTWIEGTYLPHLSPQLANTSHRFPVGMSNRFSTRGNLRGPGGSGRFFPDLNFRAEVKRPHKRAQPATAMGSEKVVGSERSVIAMGSETISP